MKRKGNLYQNLYKFENIQSAFNEVCKNTKNKKKVARFKEYKCIYIFQEYMTYYKPKHINPVHIMYLQYMNQRKEEL